jgi:hypothetical protein
VDRQGAYGLIVMSRPRPASPKASVRTSDHHSSDKDLLMTFNLSALRALDTAPLDIKHPVTGDATGWIWTIAGPGHPQTLAYQEKKQQEGLREARMKEQAQVNRKKWHAAEKEPDEVREENVANIAARVVSFSPVILTDGGSKTEYSPDAAMKILIDPAYGWLFAQVIEFLLDDAAFFQRSDAS